MYSTMQSSPDHNALADTSLLFDHNHEDIMDMSLANGAHTKDQLPAMAPISGLNHGLNGHYSEPSESPRQNGNPSITSELGSGQINCNGRCDVSLTGEMGNINGSGPSHAPSLSGDPPHERQGNQKPPDHVGAAFASPELDASLTARTVNGSHLPATINGHPHEGLNGISKKVANLQHEMSRSFRSSDSNSESAYLSSLSHSQEASKPDRLSSSALLKNNPTEFRARSSIPPNLSPEEFARQSILAADSSRLNPFALHPGEYKLLREHITPTQVTIYLNIRNAILRLWTRNPLVSVSLEEAAGCAREPRYYQMAKVAYYWLMRNGYINFGCLEVPNTADPSARIKAKGNRSQTIVVIGAGMSGLGCARQMEGLFAQLGNCWTDAGESPPKVIVLEARPRVGGRVYSHQLYNQKGSTLPSGHRCTAEMGAQIVTGFEHGNPMNVLIRAQLGIPYHGLRDNTILYDHDGTVVDRAQDMLVEKLYNDVLERASVYRTKPASYRTVEGDRHLMLFGLDPSDTGGPLISTLEESDTPLPADINTISSKTEAKPSSGVEKLAGRAYQLTAGYNPNISAAEAAKTMGWHLKSGVSTAQSLNLDTVAKSTEYPTLGETMDDGIAQYQQIVNITPKDLRLLNWHHANLEYANAVNVNQLSLSGWDQDIGNEFEGEHTEIIGGYQQVPRGLWRCPGDLDVRFNHVVKSIRYNVDSTDGSPAVAIECKNGVRIEADRLVLTTPLGVLKDKSVEFNPPLPDWKQAVIERMGFGLLNKIVLVYDEPFWETHRDMFGALNDAERAASLEQKDYANRRGRFYLFWNCIKTSGRPVLIALMAGNAAHSTEESTDESLVHEVTDRLAKMFAPKSVPLPSETIVTRWKKDPFARGSYSYVGPRTQTGDYDVMARPHGPIHFAGEATCGTHPATVHGAYLSGLRAAAEVVDSLIGPLQVPSPLVEKKIKAERAVPAVKTEAQTKPISTPVHTDARSARQLQKDDYEANILGTILNEMGNRPVRPNRPGVNPFLLYTKDHWYSCKAECDNARKAATGDPEAKASKKEIRSALGQNWTKAKPEIKQPYLDQTQAARDRSAAMVAEYNERVAEWDRNAIRIRQEYMAKHPPPDHMDVSTGIGLSSGKRLRRI